MNRANMFFGSNEESRVDEVKIFNPYTNEVVSSYPKCTPSDVALMMDIAKDSAKIAKKSKLSQRVDWLLDVAKKIKKSKEQFAKAITDETGKPISFARVEVDRCIETIEITAYEAISFGGETINTDATNSGKKTTAFYIRESVGVVGAITPFNFPLNLAAHKLAPALAMGNSVVLKPTPEAPYCAYLLVKTFIESEYAIPNALSLVYGDSDIGEAIVTSSVPRVISFTGSVAVGRIIAKNAGIKKVSLELGGNAATYIEKSANLELSAKRCAFGAFVNSGQVCISLQRIYVDEAIYDEFAKLLAIETERLKVGNPYEDDTFLSALINEDAVIRAKNWINSAISEGAKAICGNKSEGNILYPTVMIDVRDDMNIVCEEVFAPIVSLIKVKDFDEAVLKMNMVEYGLQFSIFTNDLSLANRAIYEFECGGVVINDIPTVRFDIQPYGGVKNSGIGREGPKFAFEEFSEIKSVVINY